MKEIDLNLISVSAAGLYSPLPLSTCQAIMAVWSDCYFTCKIFNGVLNNLGYYSIISKDTQAYFQENLPPHLQICTSFSAYLEANADYKQFCD